MKAQIPDCESHDPVALNRRRFIAYCSSMGLGATLLPGTLTAVAQGTEQITVDMIAAAEKLAGLSFTDEFRERFVEELERNRETYTSLREIGFDQHVPPSIVFNPIPPGYEEIVPDRPAVATSSVDASLPRTDVELALLPVTHLSLLIKTRQITSTDLTRLYIDRLKRYDPVLSCVVNLTEELALRQAMRADEEIAAGNYRGPLHGIPWGAKDLISVRGTRTTWGAEPFRDQVIDTDATLYRRLTDAGAVLVAKLATTALAGGNSWWFGGETKNPWNTSEPTGGSSIGPGAATAAGLVGFSIGTETMGSIIVPSSNCGITGLRPTFGRVSRHGVMPLSWTLDKVGPMCRTAEDCAVVFHTIYGPDGQDMSVVDREFRWDPGMDVSQIRVGYLREAFEGEIQVDDPQFRRRVEASRMLAESAVNVLRSLGIELIDVELPDTIDNANLRFLHHVESAAMFEDIVRDGRIDSIEHSDRPERLRVRQLVPGVQYLQANRARTILMQEFNNAIRHVDFYVAPGIATMLTNHTGHPALTVNDGFADGMPMSLNFVGNLFKEAEMLAVARVYQNATDHHQRHPPL